MHASILLGAVALAASVNAGVAYEPSVVKRHPVGTEGDCSAQPAGVNIVTTPDTPDAFQANPVFANAANSAAQSPPAGYSVVFSNQLASVNAGGYLGYDQLTSYDPGYCAQQCGGAQYPTCDSFDIYFERDPTLDPGANCPNPASLTYIKCAYYSSCITAAEDTNNGQYCADFHIVIAGSNGYTKNSACSGPSTTTTTTTTSKAAPTTTTTTTTSPTTTSKAAPTTTTTTTTTTAKVAPTTTTCTTTTRTTFVTSTTSPCPTPNRPGQPGPGQPGPGRPGPGQPGPGQPGPGRPGPGQPGPGKPVGGNPFPWFSWP